MIVSLVEGEGGEVPGHADVAGNEEADMCCDNMSGAGRGRSQEGRNRAVSKHIHSLPSGTLALKIQAIYEQGPRSPYEYFKQYLLHTK